MFCKKCGNKMNEGDEFCGNCGESVLDKGTIKIQHNLGGFALFEAIQNYFTNPVSFWRKINDQNSIKVSIILLIVLPIINGILNILYNSALISRVLSLVKKLPELLSKVGLISATEAMDAKRELLMSNQFLEIRNKIDIFMDNKDLFINGFFQIMGLMILTGIILFILNAIIFKNKIRYSDILLVSTSAYIPLVLALAITSIVTIVSITFGMFILISGYILSFITLYSGLIEISEEKNDKVFMLLVIFFVIVSAVLAMFITKEFKDSILSISNILKSIDSFI